MPTMCNAKKAPTSCTSPTPSPLYFPQPEEYQSLLVASSYQEPVVVSQERCTTVMVPGFLAPLSSDLPRRQLPSIPTVAKQERCTTDIIALWHSQADMCRVSSNTVVCVV